MKSYEERIEAVSVARVKSAYAETEELLEIFFDGDDLFYRSNPQRDGTYHYVKLEPKR